MGKWGPKLILIIRIFSTNVLAIWEKKTLLKSLSFAGIYGCQHYACSGKLIPHRPGSKTGCADMATSMADSEFTSIYYLKKSQLP